MLSILIPTFNFDSTYLVEELFNQCINNDVEFEILVYDDGSKSTLNKNNQKINSFKNCIFKELPNNIGRSAIRNLLAKNAKYNSLLFVDSGVFPKNKKFIESYIKSSIGVVNGGMTHAKKPPKKPFKLRWIYTKYREKNAFCSSNFLIKKAIFEKYPFDETIKTYGYEDVLFFDNLQKNNIDILKIDNPVIHNADDDATAFVKKTECALNNLLNLTNTNRLNSQEIKILLIYNKVESIKLTNFTIQLFKWLRPTLIKNFNSSCPLLFLFDFYRFGYYCLLKKQS